MSLQKPKSLNA